MKGRKHTPEQIVRKLREADRLLGEGKSEGKRAAHRCSDGAALRSGHGERWACMVRFR